MIWKQRKIHYQKLVTKWPQLAWQFAYDSYRIAFDFYQEIHETQTFFQKLQQAESLGTVCRPLDQ